MLREAIFDVAMLQCCSISQRFLKKYKFMIVICSETSGTAAMFNIVWHCRKLDDVAMLQCFMKVSQKI